MYAIEQGEHLRSLRPSGNAAPHEHFIRPAPDAQATTTARRRTVPPPPRAGVGSLAEYRAKLRHIGEEKGKPFSLFRRAANISHDQIASEHTFGGRKSTPNVEDASIPALAPFVFPLPYVRQRFFRHPLGEPNVRSVGLYAGVPHGPAEVEFYSFVAGIDRDDDAAEEPMRPEAWVSRFLGEQARITQSRALLLRELGPLHAALRFAQAMIPC